MAGTGTFRLGTGAGFSADRLDPAVDLVERGQLDAIVFECLGERTLAFAYRDRAADPDRGYTPLLERRMRAILPGAIANGVRIITNMGAANPPRAAAITRDIARELGLAGVRIAYVEGDDILAHCIQTPPGERIPGRVGVPGVTAPAVGGPFEQHEQAGDREAELFVIAGSITQ